MENIKRVLVLGPHTDDGEFGCGGTMAKFIEAGLEVHYATFSCAEESVPEGLPKDILLTEVRAAAKSMGLADENLTTFRYRVRHFPEKRQDILEDLVKLRTRINPDLVLLPCSNDIHQDHQTIHQEGIRAFKYCRILGYELPWNNLKATTNFLIALEGRHLDVKLQAIGCYASQLQAGRLYANDDFVRGWARTRGVLCGSEFAEAFECIRWQID